MISKRFFLLTLFLPLIFSCGKKYSREEFLNYLEKTDSYIAEGKRDSALKQLSALTDNVESPEHYISLAKRFMALNAAPEALIFLQSGLSRIPDSAEIPALILYILSESGKTEAAADYADSVKNTAYAGLGAEAVILSGVKRAAESDASLFEAAYGLTNSQNFLKTAALLLCCGGRINHAEYLRSKIPMEEALDDPLFWSSIAYDLEHFDSVFNDLYFSIAYAEKNGVFETVDSSVEKAQQHLLLAADAAFGAGDTELARSYWQDCADLPNSPPIALYNLALTAENEAEKAKQLVECIEKYPDYYPVIAAYVRQYIALRDAEFSDKITSYLESRGFYSMKMEELYFTLPKMIYKPENLFSAALKKENYDPRFALELFRFNHYKDSDFRNGAGDMWKILEDHPKNSDVRTYAKWYFSHCRDFNACFGVGKTENKELDAFYEGLEYSIKTEEPLKVIELFKKAAENKEYAASAMANSAYIYYFLEQIDSAVDNLSSAAELVDDKRTKSKMHYEIAVMLNEKKYHSRAVSVLGYALELDPQNYPASVLLSKLKAVSE